MEAKISLIVPVYKVEQYLGRCIESIISQSYRNLEIILVDDGSPDRCGEICDEYAGRDSRIRVIHQLNGGLSDARNSGLDIASGEYLAFVDSDDFIHPEMMKDLMERAILYDADIVQCSFRRVTGDEMPEAAEAYNERVISNIQALKLIYTPFCVDYVVAWTKLYKKALFDDLRFPKSKIHEDEFTTYKLFYRSNKIVVIDRKYYYYFQSANSIIRSNFSNRKLDYAEAMEERILFFKMNHLEELYLTALKKYALWLLNFYYRNYRAIRRLPETGNLILNKYKQTENQIRNMKAYTTRLKWTLRIAPAVNPIIGFLVYQKLYGNNLFGRIAGFLDLD